MNAAEEAINAVYRELGCLACPHWKADAIRARIGAVYLAVERGESVTHRATRLRVVAAVAAMRDQS